jgi:hypothetical protein
MLLSIKLGEVGHTILKWSSGHRAIALMLATHCQKVKDNLKLGLVIVIVSIGDRYVRLIAFRIVLIFTPVNEIFWKITHQKEVARAIPHNTQALKWTTDKNTMGIPTVIEIKKGRHNGNFQNLLQFGMSHTNIPSWMHFQHLYLLIDNFLYLCHVNKMAQSINIIGLALG